MSDLEETRLRLREWAYFFRDRARKSRAYSAEGNWQSPQVWEAQKPRPAHDPRRAVATWVLLKIIPVGNYRAITWRYCYPWLPVHIALRSLSRHQKRRVSLKDYDELVVIGEYRLAALLDGGPNLPYSPAPSAGRGRVSTVQNG